MRQTWERVSEVVPHRYLQVQPPHWTTIFHSVLGSGICAIWLFTLPPQPHDDLLGDCYRSDRETHWGCSSVALLLISHLIDKENVVAKIPEGRENSASYISELLGRLRSILWYAYEPQDATRLNSSTFRLSASSGGWTEKWRWILKHVTTY